MTVPISLPAQLPCLDGLVTRRCVTGDNQLGPKSRLVSWFLFLSISVFVLSGAFHPFLRSIFPSRFWLVMRQVRGMYLRQRYAVEPGNPGISVKYWRASDEWAPNNQSLAIAGSRTLITLGAWWDESYKISSLPLDSSGTFLPGLGPKLGGSPVQVQIAYQPRAVAAEHTVTPPSLGIRGDGFFLLLEAEGLAPDSPVRDSGYALNWHKHHGRNDPRTIQAITASTDGSAALAGDVAVAIFVMDCESNPDINISLPAGWTSLGFNNNAVDNIGYRACYKVVTTSGPQTVTCTWRDDSTFIAAGAITVFKTNGSASPIVLHAGEKSSRDDKPTKATRGGKG